MFRFHFKFICTQKLSLVNLEKVMFPMTDYSQTTPSNFGFGYFSYPDRLLIQVYSRISAHAPLLHQVSFPLRRKTLQALLASVLLLMLTSHQTPSHPLVPACLLDAVRPQFKVILSIPLSCLLTTVSSQKSVLLSISIHLPIRVRAFNLEHLHRAICLLIPMSLLLAVSQTMM